ncbi:MAG TPA: TNT domain-containing protein, partial [Kutzneria sp.]
YRLQQPTQVLAGVAVPWFGQPGGGTAYLLPKSIDGLLADDTLVEVRQGTTPPT